MSQGLGSLAGGFMAGFQMMDGYYRGQKADERADRAMGLREAESQRAADYQKWSMNRTTERDAKADEQWQATFDQSKKVSDDASKRGWAQLSLQQRRQILAEQQMKRQQQQQDDALFLQQNQHIIQGSWDPGVAQNLYANPETRAILEDPRAVRLTPSFYADPEMKAANQTIIRHLSNVTRMGADGKLDSMSDEDAFNTINTPEISKALDKALSFELSKGVGDIDEKTGKIIKSKGNLRFMPGPSGQGVIPLMDVTYEDGSTAKNRPATFGRGTGQDADTMEVPISRIIQYFGTQGNLIQQASQSGLMGTMSQALGYTEKPDGKGLRDATISLHRQMTKDMAGVDKAVAENKIQPEQAQKAKQEISETYGKQIDGLRSLYGAEPAKTGASGQGGEKGGKVATWLKRDPQLLALSQMAAQSQDPAIAQQYRAAVAADDEGAMYAVLQQVAAQAEQLQQRKAADIIGSINEREGRSQPEKPADKAQGSAGNSQYIPDDNQGLSSLMQDLR